MHCGARSYKSADASSAIRAASGGVRHDRDVARMAAGEVEETGEASIEVSSTQSPNGIRFTCISACQETLEASVCIRQGALRAWWFTVDTAGGFDVCVPPDALPGHLDVTIMANGTRKYFKLAVEIAAALDVQVISEQVVHERICCVLRVDCLFDVAVQGALEGVRNSSCFAVRNRHDGIVPVAVEVLDSGATFILTLHNIMPGDTLRLYCYDALVRADIAVARIKAKSPSASKAMKQSAARDVRLEDNRLDDLFCELPYHCELPDE